MKVLVVILSLIGLSAAQNRCNASDEIKTNMSDIEAAVLKKVTDGRTPVTMDLDTLAQEYATAQKTKNIDESTRILSDVIKIAQSNAEKTKPSIIRRVTAETLAIAAALTPMLTAILLFKNEYLTYIERDWVWSTIITLQLTLLRNLPNRLVKQPILARGLNQKRAEAAQNTVNEFLFKAHVAQAETECAAATTEAPQISLNTVFDETTEIIKRDQNKESILMMEDKKTGVFRNSGGILKEIEMQPAAQ